MTRQNWQYADNQFLNVTDNSFRLALHIVRYHNDALSKNQADPVIGAMFTAFNPLYNTLDSAFDTFVSMGGMREGGTLNLRQLLRILSGTKARAWDIAIQNVYPLGTPDYMRLLPDRRVPFQKGKQQLRVSAVRTLSLNIGSDPALATLKTDVDNFYTQINDALTAQGGNKSALQIASDTVETARVAACIGMYADLGGLMQYYAATPDQILPYFDTAVMRGGQQVVFTDNHVKPLTIHYIVKHTFAIGDTVEIENIGNAALRFFVVANKMDPPGSIYFDAAPHTKQLVTIPPTFDVTNTHVQVYNLDAVTEGQFVFDMNPTP